jgi:hypothetical protein
MKTSNTEVLPEYKNISMYFVKPIFHVLSSWTIPSDIHPPPHDDIPRHPSNAGGMGGGGGGSSSRVDLFEMS